jgi:four helix bundle protein
VAIDSYRDLVAWQKAMDLAVDCYRSTKNFPQDERYGLTSQIRRASSSITANIAEGQGRETTGAFIQFVRIAQGLLKELETHLILSRRIGYLDNREEQQLLERCDELGRIVRGLIRGLQKKVSTDE